MKTDRLHFAATLLFVMGFVLTSSGWAPLIMLGMQHRASYSVCGQDMCACLPTDAAEPDCPLCLVSDDGTKSPCASESAPTDNPRRVPNTERFEAIADATQAGCTSVFLVLIVGLHRVTTSTAPTRALYVIDQDRVPINPAQDIPAPPPRA